MVLFNTWLRLEFTKQLYIYIYIYIYIYNLGVRFWAAPSVGKLIVGKPICLKQPWCEVLDSTFGGNMIFVKTDCLET